MDGIEISSTWIINVDNGDVVENGARYPSGKKIPLQRKQRGKKLTEAGRLEQLRKIEATRDRRRVGLGIKNRD